MHWLLLLLPAFIVTMLQAVIQVDIHHSDTTKIRLSVRIACFRKSWQIQLVQGESGHRLLLTDKNSTRPLIAGQFPKRRGRLLLGILRRSDSARKYLLRHLHLEQLYTLVLLRTQDAARSALLAGTLHSVLACIPAIRQRNVCIRVLPEFFRQHSTVNARCIIRFRLGTIILTLMLLLITFIREQRQQKARTAYGTSHW